MSNIHYVCISDMHLGEEDSLLTNLETASTVMNPTKASPVMEALAGCLADLVSKNDDGVKPTLILNGDILELALANMNEAAMVFQRFIELIMPSDKRKQLFREIIYIPGNHDHHLWELARETQYVDHISSLPWTDLLPVPFHTTSMFGKPVNSYFLTQLVQRLDHLKNFAITVAYPNFGIISEDERKCIIFHHGHFTEPLYQLMSILRNMIFPDRKRPTHVWDIEAENFAWIDFFWSTMGRSGTVGKDVELIYEKLQDKKELKKLFHNLASEVAKEYDLPGWGDRMETNLLDWAFGAAVDAITGLEKTRTDRHLSRDAEKELWAYMNGPVKEQIDIEKKWDNMADVTFVFGHTHKPFQEDINLKEYPGWVNIYNTGGWIVETVEPEPLHGGAIVLVDEEFNAVSLRMYNEGIAPGNYSVRVEEAAHAGQGAFSPLYYQVSGNIQKSQPLWDGFSAAVARAVRVRAQNLRARINENG